MIASLLRLPIYFSYLLFSLCLSWWQLLLSLLLWWVFLPAVRLHAGRLLWRLRGLWLSIALLALFLTPGLAIWPQLAWSPTWSGLQLAGSQLLWLWQALVWFVVLWRGLSWLQVLAILWWWSRWLPWVAQSKFWGKLYLTLWYSEYFWKNRPEKIQDLLAWKRLWQTPEIALETPPPEVFCLEIPPFPPWWQWLGLLLWCLALQGLCLALTY